MHTTLVETDRQQALEAFLRGLLALEQAEEGDTSAAEEAIAHLHACLEWVTPQTWPYLWVEALIAKADAYVFRRRGDPLENAHSAIACYRAALCATLDDLWQWDAKPLSAKDESMYGDINEP